MKPFDVTVAFRVMIRRTPVCDAELPQRVQESRRSELRPVLGCQRHVGRAAALGQPFQDGLLHRRQSVFGPAAMREIPSPISRVQQSITHTRYAQPTAGPAQIFVMSDCQI